MSNYIINVQNTSGEKGTIIADAGFSYTDRLSSLNRGQLRVTGTGETKRSLFEIGSQVFIYRNGTLEFHGLINNISFLDAGGISADLLGYESWLGKENGDYSGSPWSSTASATIASSIIGESNYFTTGTIEAGINIDFVEEPTSSLWNALASLTRRTAQDIGIDYINLEIDILDHKGSSTSLETLNDGIQIQDLIVRQSYPIANDVRVYGKGEGITRITSQTSAGQDATSKSTYGTIRKIINDPTVTSQSEANILANALVARYKEPIKIYEFDIINANSSLVSGDVITLNAKTKGLNNEEVRIVEIEKGFSNGNEFLTLKVANKEYSASEDTINSMIAELQNKTNELQTYTQYQSEYSSSNVNTCVGGNFLFSDGVIGSLCGGLWLQADILGCGGDQICLNAPVTTTNALYILNGIDMNDNFISCLKTPTDANDAANKGYVDSAGGGGLWSDTTDPYICTCNACGICASNMILAGTGSMDKLNVGGSSACPLYVVGNGYITGAFQAAGEVRGGTVCSVGAINGGIITGSRLNVGGSSACPIYAVGNAHITGNLGVGATSSCKLTVFGNGCFTGLVDMDGGAWMNDDLDMSDNDIDQVDQICVGTCVIADATGNLHLEGWADPVVIGGLSVSGSYDDLVVVDDLDVLGTKNSVVPYNGCMLAYAAIESPESWFKEYCSAQLINGQKELILDNRFIGTTTINETHPLKVNVTPTGPCKGLMVEKYFDKVIVKELNNGISNTTFDIEISALRKGYSDLRFRTDEFDDDTEFWIKPKAKERFYKEKGDYIEKIYKNYKKSLKVKKTILQLKTKLTKKENRKLEKNIKYIDKFKNKQWLIDLEKK